MVASSKWKSRKWIAGLFCGAFAIAAFVCFWMNIEKANAPLLLSSICVPCIATVALVCGAQGFIDYKHGPTEDKTS